MLTTTFLLLVGFGILASAAGAVLTVISIRRAPIGIEDEQGFHITESAAQASGEFGTGGTRSPAERNHQLAA